MRKNIEEIIRSFFEDVQFRCMDVANDPLQMGSMERTISVENLTEDEQEEVEDLLEELYDEDPEDWDPAEVYFYEDVQLRKVVSYRLSSEYDEGVLYLYADLLYKYLLLNGDMIELDKEEFEKIKEEYENEDWDDDDDDEGYADGYISDEYGVMMHHVGGGVYCDDDGDNWEF